jgi:hypothetical protein
LYLRSANFEGQIEGAFRIENPEHFMA